jgi:hypothetical protein
MDNTDQAKVIDPVNLEIRQTKLGIELFFQNTPVLLPNSTRLAHARRPLVEHIAEEFSGFGTVTLDESGRVIKPQIISSYILLGTQSELEADSNHPFLKDFGKWLLLDLCLSSCAGPEVVDQMARWTPLFLFYEEHHLSPPSFSQGSFELSDDDSAESFLRKRVTGMCGDFSSDTEEYIQRGIAFTDSVSAIFRRLGPEEWAVMNILFNGHRAILFPLLLVTNRCTAQEYANGLMAAHCMLSGTFGDVNDEQHAEQTRCFKEDASIVLEFLEHARCPWLKEIRNLENETTEFKATLRHDLATKENNPALEHAVLKNVAGFLNTKGGAIYVGVMDNGDIFGIEADGFENNDKWALHLVSRIGERIGKRFIAKCSIDFDVLHGKNVCRVLVQSGDEPAYLNEKKLKINGQKDAFYIRGGPSAQKLSPSETQQYLATRFPNNIQ